MIRPLTTAIVAAGLLLGGCGSVVDSGESSPDQPAPGQPPADLFALNAVADPLDFAVTSLKVICSADYDDPVEQANAFCLVRDQDNNDLLGLNKYNFAVSVDPARAAKAVDPRSSAVVLTRVTAVESQVVAIIIDKSGSMEGDKLQAAKTAAKTFVDGLDTAGGDRAAVVAFSDDAQIVQPLTGDTEKIKAAIDALAAEGATNLGGAVIEAVRAVGARPGRRGAILLTDGDDTVDTVTGRPVEDPSSSFGWSGGWVGDAGSARWRGVELAQEIDLPVYTIGFQLAAGSDGAIDLEIFARATGAATGPGEQPFLPATEAELIAVFQTIQTELEASDPLDTYLYAFPYPRPLFSNLLKPKASVVVPVRTGVMFRNGNGLLRAKFGSSFEIVF
jgi:hypothetical protein